MRGPLHLLHLLVLLLLAPALQGCIFTHVTHPLDTQFQNTPVYAGEGHADIKRFKYFVADFQWDSNAIGRIARENGIEQVYYADLEELRVMGVWNQYWVHVYGR